MDAVFRCLYYINNQVSVRNWNSEFLEHTIADDVLANCNDAVSTLDSSEKIQVSVDGPKTILKLFEFLKSYRMENEQLLTHRYRL